MSDAALTVVIAPDSLKGSCSSAQAASAIAEGVRSVFGDAVEVREMPMADGGEGTLETLVSAWHGSIEYVDASDALGRPCRGRVGYGRHAESAGGVRGESEPEVEHAATRISAIIEAADANGLPAVSDRPLRPLDADTAGVGALILAALDANAQEILLCLGGSATNDGGAGMLRALGARLLDAEGNDIRPGARGLADLHTVDLSMLDARAAAVKWRIACDVDNPLTGPRGAAAVFGPQKGADANDVRAIDHGLARLAEALAQAGEARVADLLAIPGLGAAGGLALGPVALFDAQLVPGAELVSEAIGLPRALSGATIAITGEGRLDTQSLDGKVVSRVIDEAEPGTRLFVIAGSVALTAADCRAAGITAAFSIAQGPASLADLQTEATGLLAEAAAHLAGTMADLATLR